MKSRTRRRWVVILGLAYAPTTELEFLVLFHRFARTLIRSVGLLTGTDATSAGKAT